MIKMVVMIALMFTVLVALLRFVVGKDRVHDRHIQRDYEKFRRLDAQLEQQKTTIELSAQPQRPDAML